MKMTLCDAYSFRARSFGISGIRIYSRIYSGYSAPGSGIAGMEIQVFRNENSFPNKRLLALLQLFFFQIDPKRTRPNKLSLNTCSSLHVFFLDFQFFESNQKDLINNSYWRYLTEAESTAAISTTKSLYMSISHQKETGSPIIPHCRAVINLT